MASTERFQFTGSSIKFLLFLVVSPFLSYMLISRGINAIWLHPVGDEPAEFQIDRFGQDYNGERWLKVTGTPKHALAWYSEASDERQRAVFVPVVPSNWTASDPVYLIAHFTRGRNTQSDWRPDYSDGEPATLVGETAPSGVWDYQRMFPGLTFPEHVVVMYVGQEPGGSGGDMFQLAFGIAIGLVPIVFAIVLVRRLRSRAR